MSENRCHRDSRSGDIDNLADLELLVEGKKVKTNSGLLSYYSSVFATLISNARAMQEADDNEEGDFRSRSVSAQRLKLEMPNLKHKDVKTLVGCLQSMCQSKEELTALKALRILPMVEQFSMVQLKKECGKALRDSLIAMQNDLGTGNLPNRDVLQYLSAADTYNFENVRKICVDELASKADVPNRKQIVQDRHITDKTKVKIMDKMCDKMDKDYADKLKQVRVDMDLRCREIEQRRDEYMEQLETWKTDLRQEVNDMTKENTKAHAKLVEDIHQKNIVDRIEDTIKATRDRLFAELERFREDIIFVSETMETKEIISDKEAKRLRERLEVALEKNRANIERLVAIDEYLRVCYANESWLKGLSSAYTLEARVDRTIGEMEEQFQQLAVSKVKYEEERLMHEKTKAELMKLRKRLHGINTWLKWAKPSVEDEEKCLCYRHSVARK